MPKTIAERNLPILSGVQGELRLRVLALIGLLGMNGISLLLLRGFATLKEQAELRRKYLEEGGPLAAAPGMSWHNYGLAVDAVPFMDQDHDLILDRDELDWNTKLWIDLVEGAEEVGLKSGKSFGDLPHLFFTNGLTIATAERVGPPSEENVELWGSLLAKKGP